METPIQKAIQNLEDRDNGIVQDMSFKNYLQSLLLYEKECIVDAKKVAEEMYVNFNEEQCKILGKNGMIPIDIVECEISKELIKIALTYSHYTPSQREAIINELNKI